MWGYFKIIKFGIQSLVSETMVLIMVIIIAYMGLIRENSWIGGWVALNSASTIQRMRNNS